MVAGQVTALDIHLGPIQTERGMPGFTGKSRTRVPNLTSRIRFCLFRPTESRMTFLEPGFESRHPALWPDVDRERGFADARGERRWRQITDRANLRNMYASRTRPVQVRTIR